MLNYDKLECFVRKSAPYPIYQALSRTGYHQVITKNKKGNIVIRPYEYSLSGRIQGSNRFLDIDKSRKLRVASSVQFNFENICILYHSLKEFQQNNFENFDGFDVLDENDNYFSFRRGRYNRDDIEATISNDFITFYGTRMPVDYFIEHIFNKHHKHFEKSNPKKLKIDFFEISTKISFNEKELELFFEAIEKLTDNEVKKFELNYY